LSPVRLNGSTSGYSELSAPAVAGNNTITLPTGAGSANQLLKNGATAGSLAFGTTTEDASGNLAFNSGYGSVATAYGCRAWVNFNGTGTVAIRASGNVSSITDNGTGAYTINFTTAMVDTNFVVAGAATANDEANVGNGDRFLTLGSPQSGNIGRTTSTVKVNTVYDNSNRQDGTQVNVAIFR